jgi:hypothetical protein
VSRICRVGGVREHAPVDQVDRAEDARAVNRDGLAVDDDIATGSAAAASGGRAAGFRGRRRAREAATASIPVTRSVREDDSRLQEFVTMAIWGVVGIDRTLISHLISLRLEGSGKEIR